MLKTPKGGTWGFNQQLLSPWSREVSGIKIAGPQHVRHIYSQRRTGSESPCQDGPIMSEQIGQSSGPWRLQKIPEIGGKDGPITSEQIGLSSNPMVERTQQLSPTSRTRRSLPTKQTEYSKGECCVRPLHGSTYCVWLCVAQAHAPKPHGNHSSLAAKVTTVHPAQSTINYNEGEIVSSISPALQHAAC
jgi:hypothetical protein